MLFKRQFRVSAIAVLIITPILLQGIYIAQYGVNALVWDEWDTVPFVQMVYKGANWLPLLFSQHNEHRMATLRLTLAVLTKLTAWNVVSEMYFSLFLQCLTLLGLWLVYRRVCGRNAWDFIPLAWLAFGLGQYGNYLYGMQIVFYMMLVSAVWALYFLSRLTRPSLVLAILCSILSSFSISSGLLAWPAGLAFLVLARAKNLFWECGHWQV